MCRRWSKVDELEKELKEQQVKREKVEEEARIQQLAAEAVATASLGRLRQRLEYQGLFGMRCRRWQHDGEDLDGHVGGPHPGSYPATATTSSIEVTMLTTLLVWVPPTHC